MTATTSTGSTAYAARTSGGSLTAGAARPPGGAARRTSCRWRTTGRRARPAQRSGTAISFTQPNTRPLSAADAAQHRRRSDAQQRQQRNCGARAAVQQGPYRQQHHGYGAQRRPALGRLSARRERREAGRTSAHQRPTGTRQPSATGARMSTRRSGYDRARQRARQDQDTASTELHDDYFFPTLSTARNASCGISTWPTCFMRFLPSFCFSSSFFLREMSPP